MKVRVYFSERRGNRLASEFTGDHIDWLLNDQGSLIVEIDGKKNAQYKADSWHSVEIMDEEYDQS